MRIRQLIREQKSQISDTAWRTTDMQPKYAPIYVRSRPIRAGWKWRSARAIAHDDREFVLTALCNPSKAKWNAFLSVITDTGASVVARYEFHGDHPGLHTHADCDRGGVDIGSTTLDNLARIPKSNDFHRRSSSWTEGSFWDAAKRFFRIEEKKGPLL